MPADMKPPRRRRADGIAAAQDDLMAAGTIIAPPADLPLDATQQAIFAEIIDELPRGEWTPHSVRIAALLATDLHTLDHEMAALRAEGSVIEAANGNLKANPRSAVTARLHSSILAMRRSLALTARAKGGYDNRVLGRRRAIQQANEAVLGELDDDGLLALPPGVPLSRRRAQ